MSDPQLLSDMKAFNSQEGNHYKCHRRFNELVKANGYPELARIEARMTVSYAKLAKKVCEHSWHMGRVLNA